MPYLWLTPVGAVFCHGLHYFLKKDLVRRICEPVLQKQTPAAADQNGSSDDHNNAKKTRLSDGDVAEISVKVVSQVIAGISALMSLVVMWQTRDDVIRSQSHFLAPFAHTFVWYLVYDLYAMYEAYCLRMNLSEDLFLARVWMFLRKKWPFVVHHVFLLGFGYPFTINPSWRGGMGDFLIGTVLAREFSNPFILMAKILRVLKLHRTTLFKIIGALAIVSFFVVRILNSPLSIMLYAGQYHNWDLLAAVRSMKPICHTLLLLEFSLQMYWFSALVAIACQYNNRGSSKSLVAIACQYNNRGSSKSK